MSYIFTAVQISYNPTHAKKKKIDHKNWKFHKTMKFRTKSMANTLTESTEAESALSFVTNPIHNNNTVTENHRKKKEKRKIKHSCNLSRTFSKQAH